MQTVNALHIYTHTSAYKYRLNTHAPIQTRVTLKSKKNGIFSESKDMPMTW